MLKPFPTVAGPEHADAFVADRVADGADHLKIFIEDGTVAGRPMPTMSDATVVALVAAAHERGLRTAAHTWTRSAVRQAIACGVDILAHPPSDGPSDQDLIEAVAAAGAIVIATLPPLAGMSNASPSSNWRRTPGFGPTPTPSGWPASTASTPSSPASGWDRWGPHFRRRRRRRTDVPHRGAATGRHGRHRRRPPDHARHQLPR